MVTRSAIVDTSCRWCSMSWRWYLPSEAMLNTLPSLRMPLRPQSSSGTEA